MALVKAGEQGRRYRIASADDSHVLEKAERSISDWDESQDTLSIVPNEPFSGLEPRRIPLPQYGMNGFGDLFTARQLVALVTITRLIRSAGDKMRPNDGGDLATAVQTLLGMALSKQSDLTNSLCGWKPDAECPVHLFARQAIPMVWDFAEAVAISESSGSWTSMSERTAHSLDKANCETAGDASVAKCSATEHLLPNDSANAVLQTLHTIIRCPTPICQTSFMFGYVEQSESVILCCSTRK